MFLLPDLSRLCINTPVTTGTKEGEAGEDDASEFRNKRPRILPSSFNNEPKRQHGMWKKTVDKHVTYVAFQNIVNRFESSLNKLRSDRAAGAGSSDSVVQDVITQALREARGLLLRAEKSNRFLTHATSVQGEKHLYLRNNGELVKAMREQAIRFKDLCYEMFKETNLPAATPDVYLRVLSEFGDLIKVLPSFDHGYTVNQPLTDLERATAALERMKQAQPAPTEPKFDSDEDD